MVSDNLEDLSPDPKNHLAEAYRFEEDGGIGAALQACDAAIAAGQELVAEAYNLCQGFFLGFRCRFGRIGGGAGSADTSGESDRVRALVSVAGPVLAGLLLGMGPGSP